MSKALVPATELRTGRYFVRAYVYYGNKVAATCPHRHRRRLGKSGHHHAQKCAERMVRRMLREGFPDERSEP